MEIVPLSDDDRVSVRLLELACIREYAEVTLELDWNIDIPKEVRDSIGASAPKSFGYYKDTGLCFVAKERGQVVGVIFSQMLHWIDSVENVAWIENICVDEEFRRMGIGYLLYWTEKYAITASAQKIKLPWRRQEDCNFGFIYI